MENLTPEQIAEKARQATLTPAQKGIETKAKKAAEKEEKEEKGGFLNPFKSGVTYEDFIKAIPTGKTVSDYCKGKLTDDEINWISNEVECFKKNKKK